MRRFSKLLIVSMVVVAAAVIISLVVYYHRHKSYIVPKMTPAPRQPAPSQGVNSGQHPLSSVPPASRQRAKSAGYYCPSWDAQPGQISSSICYQVFDDSQP